VQNDVKNLHLVLSNIGALLNNTLTERILQYPYLKKKELGQADEISNHQ